MLLAKIAKYVDLRKHSMDSNMPLEPGTSRLISTLLLMVFSVTLLPSNNSLYVKHFGYDVLYLVVYVDDLIITGSSTHLIVEIKQDPWKGFDVTNLGLLHYCLV